MYVWSNPRLIYGQSYDLHPVESNTSLTSGLGLLRMALPVCSESFLAIYYELLFVIRQFIFNAWFYMAVEILVLVKLIKTYMAWQHVTILGTSQPPCLHAQVLHVDGKAFLELSHNP